MSEFASEIIVGVVTFLITSLITVPSTLAFTRRGELSRRVERLVEEVDSFDEMGMEYWETADTTVCPVLERRIRRQASKIGKELSRLNTEFRAYRFSDWKAWKNLRQAVTGATFEVKDRAADVARHHLITDEAEELKTAIRQAQTWL